MSSVIGCELRDSELESWLLFDFKFETAVEFEFGVFDVEQAIRDVANISAMKTAQRRATLRRMARPTTRSQARIRVRNEFTTAP